MTRREELAARDELVDLRISAFAKRPRVQSAFAIRCENWPDFKDLQAVNELQLEWLPFRLTHEDAARFEPQFELLDARSDETAGTDSGCCSMIPRSSAMRRPSICPAASIPAAFFVVMGRNNQATAISEDLGTRDSSNDGTDSFRKWHYEAWSDKFAVVEPKPLPPELEKGLITAPESGSLLRILTAKGLGLFD